MILVHPFRTVRERQSPMSLTIMYRHPKRPDEAGVVVVPDRAKAAEVKDQLENLGFLVVAIATAPFAKAHNQSD
jgi:hypothetical protein